MIKKILCIINLIYFLNKSRVIFINKVHVSMFLSAIFSTKIVEMPIGTIFVKRNSNTNSIYYL